MTPQPPPKLPAPSVPHVYRDSGLLAGGRYWTAMPGTPEAAGPPGSLRRWWARWKANR